MGTPTARRRPRGQTPRQQRQTGDWWEEGGREIEREARRRARERDSEAQGIYDMGREEGRREAREKAAARRKPSRGGKRRKAPRPARTAARQIARPVEAQVTSGFKLLGLVLLVIALYHFLRFAEAAPDTFGRFVQGPARALGWLAAPDRSIPYGVTD